MKTDDVRENAKQSARDWVDDNGCRAVDDDYLHHCMTRDLEGVSDKEYVSLGFEYTEEMFRELESLQECDGSGFIDEGWRVVRCSCNKGLYSW